MKKPSLHLNGTAREDLFQGYKAAYEKVCEAIDALSATSPHGRDYYPQGEATIIQAGAEHRARVRALERVLHQLEDLACHTMGE